MTFRISVQHLPRITTFSIADTQNRLISSILTGNYRPKEAGQLMLSAHPQTDSESFFRQSPVMSDNAGVVSIKTTVAVTLTHDTKDIHDSQTYIKAATQAREKAITNIAQTGERPAIIRRLCDRDHGATDVHLEDYVKFLLIPPLYSAVTPV